MNSKYLFLSIILIFTLFSCKKENNIITNPTQLRFNIDVHSPNKSVGFASTNKMAHLGETKAVKKDFVEGDNIYIFFEGVSGVKYATVTLQNDGTWVGSLTNLSVNELSASGKNLYAVYFPFDNVNIISDGADGVKFRSMSHTNTALDNLLIFSYYMTGSAPYKVDLDGTIATLTASLTMYIPENFVQFFIEQSEDKYFSDEKYRISVRGLKPAACESYSNGEFVQTELEATNPIWGYTYQDGTKKGLSFTGKIDNSWSDASKNHKIIFFEDGVPAISKTFTSKTLSSLDAVKLNMSAGWAQDSPIPTTSILSGTEWADWNVGASSAGGYGYYFYWGTIVGSTVNDAVFYYTSANYYASSSSSNPLSPWGMILSDLKVYGTADYRIYDAARAYYGEGWRLPEGNELYTLQQYLDDSDDNTNYVWINETTTYGTKGRLYTDALNGGTMFLPASGWYVDATPSPRTIWGPNYQGWIWGRRCASNLYASNLGFSDTYDPKNSYRTSGRNVRAVKE